MERLSAADLINLAVETPETPMHIGALATLEGYSLCDTDGRLRLAEIRSKIDRRLDDVPRLRQIIYRPGPFAGRPVWIDDPDFRVERHVHHVPIGEPFSTEALLQLATELMATPMSRQHPLWHIWFVTGPASGKVAVVIEMHHVIADGVAALLLITSLLDTPDQPSLAFVAGTAKTPRPHWLALVYANIRGRLAAMSTPRHLLASISGLFQAFAQSEATTKTSLNGPVGPNRRLTVLRLNLAEAKLVAHGSNSKINDLVLNLAAGGLRALLISRGEYVNGMSLHASVAVSMRPAGQGAEAGNRSGGIVVKLPLDETDPRERLRLVAEQSNISKHNQLPAAGNMLLIWLARLGLLRYFSRRQHLVNIVESNIAGPSSPVQLLGAPILDIAPIGTLIGNFAVSVMALSYAGTLTIAVQADAELFLDLPVLMSAMEHDWTTLRRAFTAAEAIHC